MGKGKSGASILDKYREFITPLSEIEEKPYLSLGPMSINLAVGDLRGIQTGKIIQVVGKHSSGKSTLALDIAAQYQKQNPDQPILYVDFERSVDPKYAAACGINLANVWRIHPDITEVGLDIVEQAIDSGITKLVIIDSVAASKPGSEEGKSFSDNMKVASSAGLLTRFCLRAAGLLDNNNASIVMINQLRKNMSMMSREEEIPFGGMSLQYATSLSIHLQRIKTEESKQTVQAIIKKSKVGAPQSRVEFKIKYGRGIDHVDDLLALAAERGIVSVSGSWVSYGSLKVQGMERAGQEFPMEEIRERIVHELE